MQNEAGNGLIFQKIKNVTTEVIVRDVWRVTRDAEQRRQSFSFFKYFLQRERNFCGSAGADDSLRLSKLFLQKEHISGPVHTLANCFDKGLTRPLFVYVHHFLNTMTNKEDYLTI